MYQTYIRVVNEFLFHGLANHLIVMTSKVGQLPAPMSNKGEGNSSKKKSRAMLRRSRRRAGGVLATATVQIPCCGGGLGLLKASM